MISTPHRNRANWLDFGSKIKYQVSIFTVCSRNRTVCQLRKPKEIYIQAYIHIYFGHRANIGGEVSLESREFFLFAFQIASEHLRTVSGGSPPKKIRDQKWHWLSENQTRSGTINSDAFRFDFWIFRAHICITRCEYTHIHIHIRIYF